MKCANFALIFLSILTFTTAVPVYEAQYKGIFGKLCSSITKRFEKFGKCISQTSEFQRLNSTFWFQAAKQELCGTSSQAAFVKSTTLNNSKVSVLQLKTNSGIVPINFDGNYQNDTALEYEAQYLYDLEKKKIKLLKAKIHLMRLHSNRPTEIILVLVKWGSIQSHGTLMVSSVKVNV